MWQSTWRSTLRGLTQALRAQDFDPFAIPMPLIKPGVEAEAAFKELDANNDGMITGEEFAGIPKSSNFASVQREEMVKRAMPARPSQN